MQPEWSRRCRDALNLGNRLLQEIQQAPTSESVAEIGRLLADREALLRQIDEALPKDSHHAETAARLGELAGQQQVLEAQLKSALAAMSRAFQDSLTAQANVDGFLKLMRSPRSRLLDQRR
ncbi:MAG TPA: hypothetical protein VGK74_19455 [Symbiobacteriaceae bacterium]